MKTIGKTALLSAMLAAFAFGVVLADQADSRVTNSMETLKAMTAKLGTSKLEGTEAVGSHFASLKNVGPTEVGRAIDNCDRGRALAG
jgi:hypothetical protein